MHRFVPYLHGRQQRHVVLPVLFLALIAGILTLLDTAPLRAQSQLSAPDNISCEGYERDTVVVRWKDTSDNETEYRVERAIGDNSTNFSEVETLTPDNNGNYDPYRDTGIDVDQQYRYRVRAYSPNNNSFSPSPYSEICENRHIYETDDFRIFYGLKNADDCPKIEWRGAEREVCLTDDTNSQGLNTYVARQEQVLQGSVDAFSRLGFDRSAANHDSLDLMPANVIWCDGSACARGGADGIKLSPFVLEKSFDLSTRMGDPLAWVIPMHEVFHLQQSQYWGLNDPHYKWVSEGQARSLQDKVCIGTANNCEDFDDIATGYAGYVPQVNSYLGNTNRPINQASYDAALFWTYLTEKYGTDPPPSNSVERGLNLMVKFWENSANTPGRDGVAVLNETLGDLGHSARFRDIWKDFAVANYAKDLDGPNVPDKYQYADMDEPGGEYDSPNADSFFLVPDEQIISSAEAVAAWGARYYKVELSERLPVVDVQVTQDSTAQLYYTLLAIKDNDIVKEINREARDFSETLINNDYDAVVLIVAGLEKRANYRYSINGTQPTLNILKPTGLTTARVGDPNDPGKFQVQVEVLAADGTPLAGVNPDDFSFFVDSTEVVTDNILTAATVQDQQWFVLRAPIQPRALLYDFQVNYGPTTTTTLSDTKGFAVHYKARNDADNMLLLDHSGSMDDNNKIETAKKAARLYVDSWSSGDTLGVVGFDTSASLDMQLQDWNDSATPAPPGDTRQEAFNTIDGYVANGQTAIGDALRQGWDELIDDGDTSRDWALVLLSDGLDNAGSESFDELITDLRDTNDKRPQVHAIAVGPDADRLRMQRVANVTGGSYHAVSLPVGNLQAQANTGGSLAAIDSLSLDMDYRYRVIATEAIGQQQFFNFVGPGENVSDTDTSETITIPVEGSAGELVLSMSLPFDVEVFISANLSDPNGTMVEPFQTDLNHLVWRVSNPQQGDWSLTVEVLPPELTAEPGAALQQNGTMLPNYLVHGALRSDVTMDAYLATPEEERLPGVPMPLIASLTDTDPIVGATVTADIVLPGGSTSTITLYDDGAHDDGEADDGLYSGTFYQTGVPGSYNVTVNAEGTSSLSGDFTRQQVRSFHIFSEGEEEATETSPESGVPDIVNDRDGDGIPDEWEERYGTDPDSDDADGDPDNDGAPNMDEWERGTDPFNPDTDQGGESDGSESEADRDPRNPADDAINPPWMLTYPRDGANYLWYTLEPDYVAVVFYRGDNPDGPFTQIDQNTPGTGIYIDTNVTNDTTYCYIAVAFNNQGNRSGYRDPSCVTPRVDSVGPHGSIQINGGDQVTTSPNVTLNLAASDTIDPENEIPNNPIPQPADDSSSGVAEMKIGNEGDLDDGVWETFAPSKSWTLSQTTGLATVFVQYRDNAGNVSDIYPATIRVDPTAVTAIESVQIDGPTTGVVGTAYDFTATVSPMNVTTPLSYSWQIPEQPPVTHNNVSQITDTVTADWNTPGSYTLMVTTTNAAGSTVGTHTIDISDEQTDVSITLEAAQTSIPADGSSTTTISATVRNSSGAPVANQAVSFETDLGSVNPASATTNANGVATTTLQAGTSSGTAIVIARSGGASRSINVDLLGDTPGLQLTLNAEREQLPADGSSTTTISVTVRDSNDAPVTNQSVNFETDLGSVNPASTTTDANGVATTTLQADTTTGTAIVIARSGGASRSIDIQFGSSGTQQENVVYIPLVVR